MFIRDSRRSYRTYPCSEIPEGITDQNDTHLFPLIHYPDLPLLIFHRTHTYINLLVCSTEIIHILIRRYLSTYSYLSQAYTCFDLPYELQILCLYRGTLRYYKADTYTIGFILILLRLHLFGGTRRYYRDITERIMVLRNLFLYGSTRKYYLFKCPKRRTLVLISNLSYTHTGVLVGTTEFILIRSLYRDTRRYYRD